MTHLLLPVHILTARLAAPIKMRVFCLKSSPGGLRYFKTPSRSPLFMMWILSLAFLSPLLVLTQPVLAGNPRDLVEYHLC